MSKATPGPWEVDGNTSRDGGFIVTGYIDGTHIVICDRADFGHRAEMSLANARLIAAAPDQHKALRDAPPLPQGFMEDMTREEQLEWLCTYADWWCDERCAAIAKAEDRLDSEEQEGKDR